MKTIYHICRLLFFIILVDVSFSCTNRDSDVRDHNLRKRIYSVSYNSFDTDNLFGMIEPSHPVDFYNQYIRFNKKGYMTELNLFDEEGELWMKQINTYDKRGKRLDGSKFYSGDGELMFDRRIIRGSKGLVSGIVLKNGEGIQVYRQHYVNNGKTSTKIELYDENDVLTSYQIVNWTESNCEEILLYNPDNVLERSEKNYYKNNVIVRREIGVSDSIITVNIGKHKTIRRIENGRVFILKDDLYYNEGAVFYYEYEFDKKDNWTKMVEYKGEAKIPNMIVKRDIVYYKDRLNKNNSK